MGRTCRYGELGACLTGTNASDEDGHQRGELGLRRLTADDRQEGRTAWICHCAVSS